MASDLEASLLQEILARPDDDAPRLVYADLLLERGDPRGELIQVQCAVAKLEGDDPSRKGLDERATDLLAMHEPEWTREIRALGTLGEHPATIGFRRGFVEDARLRASEVADVLGQLRKLTPLRGLDITARDAREIADLASVSDLGELETIRLRLYGPDDGSAMQAFARWAHRGRLRRLDLGILRTAARVVASTPALAGLSSLHISGAGDEGLVALFGAPHLASLKQLELDPSGIRDADALAALVQSKHLEGLEHLELTHAPLGELGARLLTRAPFAANLTLLRLGHCAALGADGVRTLGREGHLRRLRTLELRGTRLGAYSPRVWLGVEWGKPKSGPVGSLVAIEAIAASAESGLCRLGCASNFMEGETGAAFAASPAFDSVLVLDLSDNPLGDVGVRGIAETHRLPSLRSLHLAQTRCTDKGAAALGASELATRLVELDLASNDLGDRGVAALVRPGRLRTLERLVLRSTGLGADGVRALSRTALPALRSLDLGGLKPGAAAPLFAGDLFGLDELIVDGMDDADARALAASPSMAALHRLVLGGPLLTDDGAVALASAPGFERLQWLELDANGVGERGREALRARFGYRVAVFAGGGLSAFRVLTRPV